METSKRFEGQTPSGVAYVIVYWKDAKGNPTTKDKAVATELVEFDDEDQVIQRIYGTKSSQP